MCALVSQDKTRLTRLVQRLQDILKNIKNSQTCSQNTSNVVHNNFFIFEAEQGNQNAPRSVTHFIICFI